MRKRAILAVSGVTVAALIGGGLWFWLGPDRAAKELAENLADGLSSGDVTSVDFAGLSSTQAQERWEELVAQLGTSPHKVTVDDVQIDGNRGQATLDHIWRFEHGQWKYKTRAALQKKTGDWRVVFAPDLAEPSLKTDEILSASTVKAQRGAIVGDNKRALVKNRIVLQYGIDKTKVASAQQKSSATQLAELLDIKVTPYVKKVRAAGDKAFVEAIALRPDDVPARVKSGHKDIEGAVEISEERPLGPTRDFGQPLIGSVGPVTKEMVEDGDYDVGDRAGLSGLQRRYDAKLSGRPGLEVHAVNTDTAKVRKLFSVDAQDGNDLQTTLNLSMQKSAEHVLSDVKPSSAIVAIRPSDGHILAAANGRAAEAEPTATVGQYAPGSTFKIVTALALMRSGVAADDTLTCRRNVTVDGMQFENYDEYPDSHLGKIPLSAAVAHSCNTALIARHNTASQQDLVKAAASLGIGVDLDVGFPAFFGSVPAKASTVEHAASMIGQGKITASPLAMATVAASVAHGKTVVPTLLPDHKTRRDKDADEPEPLKKDEAKALRSMMRKAVTSGSAQFLSSVPGKKIMAKTGTAEYGTKNPPDTRAWMIAIRGDLAVAVFVAEGDSGSGTAGPLLEEFLESTK